MPPAIANAAYNRQKGNPGVTEYVEITDRGHSLTIDHGCARSPTPRSPLSSASPSRERPYRAGRA